MSILSQLSHIYILGYWKYDHYISPDISMLTHIHYQIENIPIGNIKRLSLGNYWNII